MMCRTRDPHESLIAQREDHFIPGLKARGHEDVLGWTPADIVASLPTPPPLDELDFDFEEDAPLDGADRDWTVVLDAVRRHVTWSQR